MPPKSTPGDGSRSTWGDPCVPATGSPILGDARMYSPPKIGGAGGAKIDFCKRSIQQKLMSWGNTYEIYRDSEVYATMNESFFTSIGRKFTVDIPGADDLKVKGNFSGYEYTFERASGVVATVSKKWASVADTYAVDIIPGEDDVLILACTVVIGIASDA